MEWLKVFFDNCLAEKLSRTASWKSTWTFIFYMYIKKKALLTAEVRPKKVVTNEIPMNHR